GRGDRLHHHEAGERDADEAGIGDEPALVILVLFLVFSARQDRPILSVAGMAWKTTLDPARSLLHFAKYPCKRLSMIRGLWLRPHCVLKLLRSLAFTAILEFVCFISRNNPAVGFR